jgi:hypothetical protein
LGEENFARGREVTDWLGLSGGFHAIFQLTPRAKEFAPYPAPCILSFFSKRRPLQEMFSATCPGAPGKVPGLRSGSSFILHPFHPGGPVLC